MMSGRHVRGGVLALGMAIGVSLVAREECRGGQDRLAEAVAKHKIPPEWFKDVALDYGTSKPWKEAWKDVTDLLNEGGPKAKRGIRILYEYAEKKGHRPDGYPFFLMLGGEPLWAASIFLEQAKRRPAGFTEMYINLASLYLRYGEGRKALDLLHDALQRPPRRPWDTFHKAKINDKLGDAYAATGEKEKAIEHYRTAIELFPKAELRKGRHLLPRYARKTEAKIELLTRDALSFARVPDGIHRGNSIGFGGPLNVDVTVKSGRVVDIKVEHKERIDQGATKIAPRQIIERQKLELDAITGATVTVQAVVEATYRALSEAGARSSP